ncbi:MAG TPA: DMT family transporter [Dongiaceae bacterium]|jgi:drug/metabolite transporter (DMT)-like permease|nr:DMT family transporter [Dongiaceae bacterium]
MWISAGAIVAFTAAVFFSTKAIFVKLTYLYGADAISALALRMIMALPMLLALAWYSMRGNVRPLTRADWKAVFLLGFVGYYLSSLLDFLGLEYITASLERLILFLYPTIVALISWLFLKRPIGAKGIAALALSYVGIAISFVRDLQHTGDSTAVLIGGGLVFACTVTYAIYIVGSGEMVGRIGALRFGAYASSVSAVCCVIQFLLTRPLTAATELPWQVYGYSLAMAVVATVLPVIMTAKAIQMIGAPKVAIIGAVGPVATIILAWWLLGEPIGWEQIVGAALVLSGVLLISVKARPKPVVVPAD